MGKDLDILEFFIKIAPIESNINTSNISMKRIILLSISFLLVMLSSAQTQKGYVKTKGRMVNGQHVPGQGLPGATVNIQGGNSVGVKNANGSFSFVVPSKTFFVQSVQKKGYELVDADVTSKPYYQSENPLVLLMETPEQQMEDLLEAEEKISRILREKLNKARQEIKQLKEQNKISEVDYRQQLAKLMEDQMKNKDLIADMAKEYAQMDYDQLDSINQRIYDALLNGRLTEADSLLRSKGDMRTRIAEIHGEQRAESQEQAVLEKRKANTQKKLEDAAADCYRFFERFKLENLHDSAACYIELRAKLDTTNFEWQYDAGSYFSAQNQYQKATQYFEKALLLSRHLVEIDPVINELSLAKTLHSLATLYKNTQRFTESEAMYKEAIEIFRRLTESDPMTYKPYLANTLNSFSILYRIMQRYSESEALCIEALEIYRQLVESDSNKYEEDLASTLNNLGLIYSDLNRFTESEKVTLEALEIYRRLTKKDADTYETYLASVMLNLAILYYQTQRFPESEAMYKEALEIRRRLAEINPQAYEPRAAATTYNLAMLYHDMQRYEEAEAMYKEALALYQRLSELTPNAYEPRVATAQNAIAILYEDTHRYMEAETMYKEALKTFGVLAEANPQTYKPDVAMTLSNIGRLNFNLQRYDESIALFQQSLETYRSLAADNPQVFEPYLAISLANLASIFKDRNRFDKSEKFYKEALDIRRRLAEANPQVYEANYAKTINGLAGLYQKMKRYEESIEKGKEAMEIYERIFKNNPAQPNIGTALAETWENLSYNSLFLKRFTQAEQYAREGLSVDSTQQWLIANLAVALLFQGKTEDAEQIYLHYKDKLKDYFLDDLNNYAEEGIIPKEQEEAVKRIKQMLVE